MTMKYLAAAALAVCASSVSATTIFTSGGITVLADTQQGLDRFVNAPAGAGANTLPPQAAGDPPVPGAVGAVPEPASWAMLLAGFGGLGMAARRRRAVSI
jgi:hypothetical protein